VAPLQDMHDGDTYKVLPELCRQRVVVLGGHCVWVCHLVVLAGVLLDSSHVQAVLPTYPLVSTAGVCWMVQPIAQGHDGDLCYHVRMHHLGSLL
jgi:hypothetical protein